MDEARAAIALESVSKRFGSVGAVNGVSLEIREGEFFSLLGPSGCGKTTTLRMQISSDPVEGKLKRPYDFPEARSIAAFGA